MKKALVGFGGHSREIMAQMNIKLTCFVDDEYITEDCLPLSSFNPNDYNFLKHSPWSFELLNSIKRIYNIDTLSEISKLPDTFKCSMTSNHTFSKKTFEKYMEWMEPMINDIKISQTSGHQAERSISVFYILNKIKNIKILPNILHHFQLNSHRT
jgi:hypothetical protein